MRTTTLCLTIAGILAAGEAQTAQTEQVPPVVLTIAYEASGEPLEAQARVACAIRNRARERHQTEEQVVYARKQFSCWKCPGMIAPGMAKRTEKELKTANMAYLEAKNMVFKANLYHDTSIECPWKGVEYLGQWGRIKFYYEER